MGRSPKRVKSPKKGTQVPRLIRADNDLSANQAKYCSCVVQVAAKNSPKCNQNLHISPKRSPRSKGCTLPYAVCAASTRTTSRKCGENYAFENFTNDELKAYMDLRGIATPSRWSRKSAMESITNYLQYKKPMYEKA